MRWCSDTLQPDDGGVIAVDRDGNLAAKFNSAGMYRGLADATAGSTCASSRIDMRRNTMRGRWWRCSRRGRCLCAAFTEVRRRTAARARCCWSAAASTTTTRRSTSASSSSPRARRTPRIVIATAATGPQDEEATDKTEALRTWAPGVPVDRGAARDRDRGDGRGDRCTATAMFFTGGDQKRITERYRPGEATRPNGWRCSACCSAAA
jgi:hypothetical protein